MFTLNTFEIDLEINRPSATEKVTKSKSFVMLLIAVLFIQTGFSTELPKNETDLGEHINSTVNYPFGQDVVIKTLKEIASRVR